MKTTIIIKNNFKEVVLTPEDDTEKDAIDLIIKKDYSIGSCGKPDKLIKGLKAYRGEFYNCQGGWMREGSGDDSLILVFDDKEKWTLEGIIKWKLTQPKER